MSEQEHLEKIYDQFSAQYGSRLPYQIRNGADGLQLEISYRHPVTEVGGTFVVRKATEDDLQYAEVTPGVWLVFVMKRAAGATDLEEVANDLFTIATVEAGQPNDAESFVA